MRYIVLVVLLVCVGFGVSLIVSGLATPVTPDATAHTADTQSFFFRGYSAAREFVQDLVDGFAAPLRGRTGRVITPGPLPQ
jgi:hypothetical protein